MEMVAAADVMVVGMMGAVIVDVVVVGMMGAVVLDVVVGWSPAIPSHCFQLLDGQVQQSRVLQWGR